MVFHDNNKKLTTTPIFKFIWKYKGLPIAKGFLRNNTARVTHYLMSVKTHNDKVGIVMI